MKKYLLFWPSSVISHNLWDEAYILGCIEEMQDGKILLLASKKTNFYFLKQYQNIEIIEKEWWKIFNVLTCIRFLKIGKFDAIYHIWADCLDGTWWKMGNIKVLIFLIGFFIARKTKIVSFSFKKTHFQINKYMLSCLSKYAHFFPRDSISMKNIEKEYKIKNITLASDTSFLAKKRDLTQWIIKSWIVKQKIDEKKIVMICIEDRPGIQDINLFIHNLADEVNTWGGWAVCIVRHTFDEKNHLISERFFQLISQEKIYIDIQDVNVVRKITEEVDIVASCLMHCALWAVAAWVPIVVLDYFWKATWLFQDLGLGKYVCTDESKFIQHMQELRDNRELARQEIQEWNKIARERALKIFRE